MLNQLLRYLPALDSIMKHNYKKILEVGSGSKGIGKYITIPFVGCDLSYADYNIRDLPIESNLIPVKGSAEYLPLKDNSFEIVISLDMLEHTRRNSWENIIKELVRVTNKHVFLAFPCGEKALEYDRKLYNHYKSNNKKVPPWLIEHLKNGFISDNEIIGILNKNNFSFTVRSNENVLIHYFIMILESLPRIEYYLTKIANLIGQQYYNKESHLSFKPCLIRVAIYPFMFFASLLNCGSAYRKIFIISK